MRRLAFALSTVTVTAAAIVLLAASPCSAACGPESAAPLYARARRAFEEKRFDDSIVLLREAHACDPNPVYLANIARALEEAGRPKPALEAWQSYRDAVTDEREKSRAQGRIAVLSKTIDEADRAERDRDERARRDKDDREKATDSERQRERETEQKQRRASESAAPPGRGSKPGVSTGAIVVTGVGAAGLIAGTVLALLANGKHDDAVAEPDASRASALQGDAVGLGHAATATLIASGVVAAGGLVWIGIDVLSTLKGDTGDTARRSPARVMLTGRGLTFAGTF